MPGYGRNVIGPASTGIPLEVAASGPPEWMEIGAQIDWGTVAAVGSDTTTPGEGLIVPSGRKYLRYGQVMCEITAAPVQTLTITGSPDGGTFTLTGTTVDTGMYASTGPLAYNISNLLLIAALQSTFGNSITPITVTGTPGTNYVITSPLGLLTVTSGLTGGTAPAIANVLTTAVANNGMWGPHNPSATDGRQTLTNGQIGILNTTILELGVLGYTTANTATCSLIVGGMVWEPRLLIARNGVSASLAAGPTRANLVAAMPRLQFVGI